MRRKQFLKQFLSALGAEDIHWVSESEEKITGRVIYETGNPDEIQDFVWWMRESDAPSDDVMALAELLNERGILSIDKITVSTGELRAMYCAKSQRIMSENEFVSLLNDLLSIEVPMVDDGIETDIFFIHG